MSIYSFLLLIGLFSVSVLATSNENQAALEKWFNAWPSNQNRNACGNRLNYAIWRKCGKKYPLDLNGGVTAWSAYKRCTNCGANINYERTRTCTQPKPSGSGSTCPGVLHETLKCGMQGFCKEIREDVRQTEIHFGENKTSLASCMEWCRSKGDCGFVAYGVKGEQKENWCLRFPKLQLPKSCTPTYAAAERKKADVDIEYNIHFNNEACDQMNFEHNTCGHIKDGVGNCLKWDESHLGHFYDNDDEASCRKRCEATEGCGVFTLGKTEGNRAGYCDLWATGSARVCKVNIDEKANWRMFSKNKCDDEAIRKWGPVRFDGKCGASIKADCTSGRCCSKWGWCGTSASYCDEGTKFNSGDAPANIELFDEPNKFEMIERGKYARDAETLVKSPAKEEDDKFAKDDTPVKGMKALSDVLTARNAASQFLHSRAKRGLYHECCQETCDHHEIYEICEDKRENKSDKG